MKNEKTLLDMVIASHNEWKILSKNKNLQNEFQEKKGVAFLHNCEKTLWVVTAQWEEKAREKIDLMVKMTMPFYKESKKQITQLQLEAWTEGTRVNLLVKESTQMKKMSAEKKKRKEHWQNMKNVMIQMPAVQY